MARTAALLCLLFAAAGPAAARAQDAEGGQGGQLTPGEGTAPAAQAAADQDRHDALLVGYAYTGLPNGFPVVARVSQSDTGHYAAGANGGPSLSGGELRFSTVKQNVYFSAGSLKYVSDSAATVDGVAGLSALSMTFDVGIGYMADERITRTPGVAVGGGLSFGVLNLTLLRYTDPKGVSQSSVDIAYPLRVFVAARVKRFAIEAGVSKDLHLNQLLDVGSTPGNSTWALSIGVAVGVTL